MWEEPGFYRHCARKESLQMTNTPQTEPLSLLDGVEPDFWIRKMLDICGGEVVGFSLTKDGFVDEDIAGTTEDLPHYSCETVKTLLAAQRAEYEARIEANRREVLLEAAGKIKNKRAFIRPGASLRVSQLGWAEAVEHFSNVLRRMALEPTGVDKGEG
jgi:hypothetical protein